MRYQCPDCAGTMRTTAILTDPPIYEANCLDCGVTYRRFDGTPVWR